MLVLHRTVQVATNQPPLSQRLYAEKSLDEKFSSFLSVMKVLLEKKG
jgi:hypothetical protein